MDQKSSSERLAEAMERARRHWQARGRGEALPVASAPAATRALTVALSREAGTSGTVIARALGARLGWPVYDRELLQRIAGEMGLRANLLESVDEKRRSWLLEFLETFSSVRAVSESAFVRNLIETVLALGAHGECIIVGRGAAQILPAETTLRVRLVAPLGERIATKARELAFRQEEAARRVETTDRERTRFVKDHFQKDPTDPRLYDFVLNSSRFTVAQCAELIMEALRRLQARAPAERPEPCCNQ
jgi:cytidylate kinase